MAKRRENRTLHLMENAREERRLHKEAHATEYYFGRVLAERMMARAEMPPVLMIPERARDIVAEMPRNNDVLDFRPHIQVNTVHDARCSPGMHAAALGCSFCTNFAVF